MYKAVGESKSWDKGGTNRAGLHIAGGALIGGLGGGEIGGETGTGILRHVTECTYHRWCRGVVVQIEAIELVRINGWSANKLAKN
ncbi:hypothetical protein [Paraburkholderia sacchari]|uniref:Uncharacterized protein n=1 Tax=Paraburkholderia sacchari TaxID=159450 RepID=A0A8T6ZG16_9BURK|nr:hypothetical protein [Paraburkholderia sacchari]NLP63741.1 hypothetical protein [Paraburkholderia sacchari]